MAANLKLRKSHFIDRIWFELFENVNKSIQINGDKKIKYQWKNKSYVLGGNYKNYFYSLIFYFHFFISIDVIYLFTYSK